MSVSSSESEVFAVEDHPIKKTVAKESVEFFKTDVRFAQYDPKDILVGTVGGSHTVHFMEAVNTERPCTRPEISKDGVLDKPKFFANPDFRYGCEMGVKVSVMKWEIEEMFHEVPMIYQSALNAKLHVGTGSDGSITCWFYIYMCI